MTQVKKKNIIFWILMAGVYLVAWHFQSRLFINWDISYLLHAAKLLLAGGSYTQDFFMPNPPLILYLYFPPLMAATLFKLNIIFVFRLYIFLLVSVSLGLGWFLTTVLFPQKKEEAHLASCHRENNALLRNIFILTLAVVFLIVPIYDFGQREHLLVIFSLPYLLLVACRLEGYSPSSRFAALIGFLSGLGFAIKPQFLVTPLLIELYYLWVNRNFFAWARTETLVLLIFLVAYALSCFIFYPDYIFVILPYLLRNYYLSIGNSWRDYLANATVIFCFLPFPFYLALYKKNVYKKLSAVLMLALVGFLVSYIAQHTNFYYHCLPAFSLAILSLVYLFSVFALQPELSRYDYFAVSLIGALFLALLFFEVRVIWTTLLLAPALFYSFFGILFMVLLALVSGGEKIWKVLSSVLLILALGSLCSYLAQRISWSPHSFLITTVVLLLLFGLFASRLRFSLSANIFIAGLGMLIFAYPAYLGYCIYWRSLGYKEQVLNKLIGFLEVQVPHRSIAVFSMKASYGSPLVDYADSQLAQRFDCLWPVVGFVKQANQQGYPKAEPYQYQQDKNLFIKMITEDLHHYKPDLIFIDKHDPKLLAWDKQFTYLAFFSQSPEFKKEWKAYRYLTTIQEASMYELEVYKRVPSLRMPRSNP